MFEFLTITPTNAAPNTEPGIPAATVNPDWIPAYALEAPNNTAKIIPITITIVFD